MVAILVSIFAAIMFVAPTGIFFSENPASFRNTSTPLTGASASYEVSFYESGLPSIGANNVVWAVTFDNTTIRSDNSVINFFAPAGNYSYSIGNLSGIVATPNHGNITVTATDVIINVLFSSTYYSVTFSETGLLPGSSWQVKVDNITERGDTSQIVFKLQNGTYNYSANTTATGYYPSLGTGSFVVSGNNLAIHEIFTSNLEKIVFFEKGLPKGTQWGVSINGVMVSHSDNSSIVFNLKNATYHYSIQLSESSNLAGVVAYNPTPSSGTVYSNKSYHNISVSFTAGYDILYFNETGLPSTSSSNASIWSVNLSGIIQSSNRSSMEFFVANGLYKFSIPSVGGYLYMYPAKNITVNSNQYTEPVLFVQNYSYIKFFAKVLPRGGTSFVWGVNISGLKEFTDNNSIVFTLPANKTETYSVINSQDFEVLPSANASKPLKTSADGKVFTVNLSFNGTGSPTGSFNGSYNELQFISNGLPYGSGYSVTLNSTNRNVTESSDAGGLVTFTGMSTGTFTFWVSSSGNYIPIERSGSVTVSPGYKEMNLTFVPFYYQVSFSERGLPSGITWSVGITTFYHGTASYSSNAYGDISTSLSNGSYYYFVQPIKTNSTVYNPVVRSGFFIVNGTTTSINVTFFAVEYPVTFTELGLPAGSSWGVNLSGTFYSSNSTGEVNVNLLNGTYQYTINGPTGYLSNVSAGIVSVSGNPLIVKIQFVSIAYSVNFVESGLPAGTDWNVQLMGLTFYSDKTGVVSINLENGTYPYVVPDELIFYVSNVSGGVVAVNNSQPGLVVYLHFHSVMDALTLTENNLPAGTSWEYSISGSQPVTVPSSSTTLTLPNGTYSLAFLPVIIGSTHFTYYPIPSLMYVPLNGSVALTVNFSDFVYPVTITESGLPAGTSWSAYVNQKLLSSNTANISTELPNGTYSYLVPNVNINYYPNVRNGTFDITGQPFVINITFHEQKFAVNFNESGLGAGLKWTVNVTNVTFSKEITSASSAISFSLPNGSYSYSISSLNSDYEPSVYGGNFTVNAGNLTFNVSFEAVVFNVTFTESGLATRTLWSVNLNGQLYSMWSNNSTSIRIYPLFNGTYTYAVTQIPGYTESTSLPHSPFNISGKSVAIHIYFVSNSSSYTPPPSSGSSGFHLPSYAIVVIVAVGVVGAAIAGAVAMSQKKKKK